MIMPTVTPTMIRGFLVMLLIGIVSISGYSQSDRIQLKKLLDAYERQTGINISYDPGLVTMLRIAPDQIGDTADLVLDDIIAQLPLQLDIVNNEYAILSAREFEFSLSLVDSLDEKAVPQQYVTILKNNDVLAVGESGDDGTFRFNYQPKVGDSLFVFVTGFEYEALSLEGLLSQDQLQVDLSRTTYFLDNVIVQDYLTRGIDLNPVNQSIGISVKDLPSLPGETDGDIFASLGILPGLSTPDNRAGSLFIRGSSPDQSLILYDNIPIYHTGYYFGTISPYNPKVIDDIEVYRSGVHPGMGDRVGGAVLMNSSEDLSTEPQGGVGLNSLYALAYVKAPILKNKVGFALGARRAYPSSFNSPKLDAITDVVYAASSVSQGVNGVLPQDLSVFYEDYNAKLEIPVSENLNIAVSGIYASNEMKYEFDLDSGLLDVNNGFKNQGVNAKANWKLSENLSSTTSATYSDYEAYFNEGSFDESNLAYNYLTDLDLNQGFSLQLRNFTHEFGGGYRMQDVKYRYSTPLREIDSTARRGVPYDKAEELKGSTISAYYNTIWNGVDGLTVQFGMRGCYYDQMNQFNLMPRGSFSYDLTPNWMLKGSYGSYRQYLSQVKYLEFSKSGFDNHLWALASDDGLSVIKGDQFMGGLLYSADRVVFDMEIYRKNMNDVTYTTTLRFLPNTEFITVDYVAKGVDFFLKFKANENMDVWAGYTYSRLLMAFDSAANDQYPSKYDQPHKIYIGAAFTKNNLTVSGGWRLSSGQYGYSAAVRKSEMIYLRQARAQLPPPPTNPPPPGSNPPPPPRIENPYDDLSRRLNPVQMLDISASYRLPKKPGRPFKTTFGLSLLNVYNADNLTDLAIRSTLDTGEDTDQPLFFDRNAIGFAPNLMITIEW